MKARYNMKLTKAASELQIGDVFYVGSADLRMEVLEVEPAEDRGTWCGDELINLSSVAVLLEGETATGWEFLPAGDLVRLVTQAQYKELQK